MLRLYKSIDHDIFKLHQMLEHLVCSVWCEAYEDELFESLIHLDFKKLLPYKINRGHISSTEGKGYFYNI